MNEQSNHQIAKSGDVLLLTEGEYSDFDVLGIVIALVDFDPLDARDEYVMSLPLEERYRSFNSRAFIESMVEKGLVEIKAHKTLHLGEYADADRVMFEGRSREMNLP